MKKILLITIVLIIPFIAVCQKITVSGKVTLENNIDNSGVKVLFKRLAPSVLLETTYTDFSGNFNYEIEKGIYKISFSKDKFLNEEIAELNIFSDFVFPDKFLSAHWLANELSDTLFAGKYKSNSNIEVPIGKTLVIMPGTEISFLENVKFIVKGRLIAEGTKTDSIIFKEYDSGKTWSGLYFTGKVPENKSKLKYVYVKDAKDAGLYSKLYENIVVLNSSFSNNKGHGLIFESSNVQVENVLLSKNVKSGLTSSFSNIIVNNCISDRNSNYGFDFRGGIFSVSNCTAYKNGWVGFYAFGDFGDDKLINSIALANDIGIDIIGNPTVFNCCSFASTSPFTSAYNPNFKSVNEFHAKIVTVNNNGTPSDAYGNIFVDPLFNDPSSSDFSLKSESPCINAGDNNGVTTYTDFMGVTRILGGVVDMGALEFDIPTSIIEDKADSEKLIIYPNPVNNVLFIKNNSSDFYNISIINYLGQTILQFSNESTLNISDLIHGMYLIKISTPNETITYRFLKL